MTKSAPDEDESSEISISIIPERKRFISREDLEKILLEREQKAPNPDEHIRKPPPNYGADKRSFYTLRQGNVSWTRDAEESEPLPSGAELIRGPTTTIEMVREFLHLATEAIANDDDLWRLAYAIDLNRFKYAWGKDAREGRTDQTEAKRRTDRIVEYTKRLNEPNGDKARHRLRELWLEELKGSNEDLIEWIMENPRQAIERILLLRRPLFNPWHECAKDLATTYAKLFARTEQLTEKRACSKTGTLVHFLSNALEEITGQSHQPAAIAKVLREDLKAYKEKSVEKKFRDIP